MPKPKGPLTDQPTHFSPPLFITSQTVPPLLSLVTIANANAPPLLPRHHHNNPFLCLMHSPSLPPPAPPPHPQPQPPNPLDLSPLSPPLSQPPPSPHLILPHHRRPQPLHLSLDPNHPTPLHLSPPTPPPQPPTFLCSSLSVSCLLLRRRRLPPSLLGDEKQAALRNWVEMTTKRIAAMRKKTKERMRMKTKRVEMTMKMEMTVIKAWLVASTIRNFESDGGDDGVMVTSEKRSRGWRRRQR